RMREAYGAWLSPNGGYVAWTKLGANEVWGWDFRQKRSPERLAKVEYGIGNIAFSRDGQLLALPADGDDFVTWDMARRSVIRRFSGHSFPPDAYAFSPVDDRLVSGSYYPASEVRLWTADGKLIHRQNIHRNSVSDLAYSPDGSRIASASLDQTIGLWHGATLEPVALLRGHTGKVLQVQFTPDSKRLVSRSDDLSIRL